MSDYRHHSLLVVDDDPLTCSRVKAYFEQEGYLVLLASNGDEMWTCLRQQQVDVVLLDIGLPGRDGLELARELRARNSRIGLLLVTGRNDDIDKIVGLESGADDYVTKPFNARELLARVKIVLRRLRDLQASPQSAHQIRIERRAARPQHGMTGRSQISAAMAWPSSVVLAPPPRSGVRGPSRSTVSIARTMASWASRPAPCPRVRKSSISAPDQIIATGLAMLRP